MVYSRTPSAPGLNLNDITAVGDSSGTSWCAVRYKEPPLVTNSFSRSAQGIAVPGFDYMSAVDSDTGGSDESGKNTEHSQSTSNPESVNC